MNPLAASLRSWEGGRDPDLVEGGQGSIYGRPETGYDEDARCNPDDVLGHRDSGQSFPQQIRNSEIDQCNTQA